MRIKILHNEYQLDFRKWSLSLVLFSLFLTAIPMQAENTIPAEKISIEEAFTLIGIEYGVHFNYDRAVVSDVEVNYESGQYEKVEDALQSVFSQTHLKYEIFDQRYVAVYRQDREGVESMKKMVSHFQEVISSSEEAYRRSERRVTSPLASLPMKDVFSKKLVFSVSGMVTDQEGEPLIGVNIQVKDSDKGTSTDFDGKFFLEDISENAVLIVSYVGYQTQEIVVAGKINLEIVMTSDSQLLDEVVVVGYGTMKKSDLTGSVQRINVSEFDNQMTTNMIEMLNGTVAGFISNQGTSASGGGSMEIRGPTSLAADINPLIVLDGVIYNGSIGDINPNDIESIDILKDASSAAIFGARSSAGILIVTTKRGKTSKPTINFSTKIGLSDITNHMPIQTPAEYLKGRGDFWSGVFLDKPDFYYSDPTNLPPNLSIEEWKNFDLTPSDDPIQMWFDRLGMKNTELENYKNDKIVDWYDLITRKGLRQDYDISLSGGSETLRYYVSLGYTDNEGVILGDDYKNIRSRVNIDAKVTDFFTIGANVQFANRDQSSQMANLTNAIRTSPFGNIYEEDGKTLTFYPYEEREVQNPLLYYQNREKIRIIHPLFATVFSDIKLPYGLSYRIAFVNSYSWEKDFYFDPITTPIGLDNKGYGIRKDTTSYEWQIDNVLSWNRTLKDIHEFDVTFLFNAEKFQSWKSVQENTQFAPSGALSFHALQAGISPSLSNDDQYSTGTALMARINYNLSKKYLITASWRRDGYSAFGGKHPYAEFPALAIGWWISEEEFFKVNWLDHLKLRVSWGMNGNRGVGRYDALARLATTKYIYGSTLATGVYSNTMANADLRWERTETLNFGVDFGLFENVVQGSIEYYDMVTNDLLLNRSLPRIIGYESVTSNLGELGNKGFEMTLSSRNITRVNFNWNSNLVFSLNRNKIKHLYGEMINVVDGQGNVIGVKEADDIGNQWFIGKSIDRIWDYEILGIYQLGEEEEAKIYGKRPGDFKLKDVNEDHVLNSSDKIFQGYKNPRYRLGFRNDFTIYRNFEISAFIRADLDFYRENNLHLNSINNTVYERFNRIATKYWTKDNPINDYARLNSDAQAPSFNYWENSSFIRLQDFSIAYNFPSSATGRLIRNLRIFVNFRNLVTVTKWEHYDPESGTTMMPRTYGGGINFTF